jgi:hypothetical protein
VSAHRPGRNTHADRTPVAGRYVYWRTAAGRCARTAAAKEPAGHCAATTRASEAVAPAAPVPAAHPRSAGQCPIWTSARHVAPWRTPDRTARGPTNRRPPPDPAPHRPGRGRHPVRRSTRGSAAGCPSRPAGTAAARRRPARRRRQTRTRAAAPAPHLAAAARPNRPVRRSRHPRPGPAGRPGSGPQWIACHPALPGRLGRPAREYTVDRALS